MNVPDDLRPYETHCHKIIAEEHFKRMRGTKPTRTFRHRMARGMLQTIYHCARKRMLKNEVLP